jgi:hypothetical protein
MIYLTINFFYKKIKFKYPSFDIFNLSNQITQPFYIKKEDPFMNGSITGKKVFIYLKMGNNQPYLADAKEKIEEIKLYCKFLTTWMNILNLVIGLLCCL